MSDFNEIALELVRQKKRLTASKDALDTRAELANNVYPLMAMSNEAISKTLVALSEAIEHRMSSLEAYVEEVLDDEDDDDDGDFDLEPAFIKEMLWAVDALLGGHQLAEDGLERARRLRAAILQMTDDNGGDAPEDAGAEGEAENAESSS